jgi:hypothetical protein
VRSSTLFSLVAGSVVTLALAVPSLTATRNGVFRSSAGQFSVRTSLTPTEQEHNVKNSHGTVATKLFFFHEGSQVHLAGYCDLPGKPSKAANISATLDGMRAGLLNSMHGTLIYEKKYVYGANVGRELRIEGDTGRVMLVRAFITGGRLYHVGSTGDKDAFSHPKATEFMDSFKLTSGQLATRS